jgi:Tfp pilus assembly protein PilW
MKKENGFTLVETIVALFIGMLMLTAIYTVVNSAQRSSSGIEKRVIAQQDARAALELMAMEIRMASYNPNSTTGNWLQSNDCSTVSGNQNYRGIQEATATSITVEMDMNEDCTENGDPVCMRPTGNPNEVIRYNYDAAATNLYITRSTNCGAPQPFLGDTAANDTLKKSKTVLVVNDTAGTGNTAIPVFRYYDGTGNDISATVVTNPASLIEGIPAIRRVEITLVVDTASSDPVTGARRRIIYSTSVIPRNHMPVPTY